MHRRSASESCARDGLRSSSSCLPTSEHDPFHLEEPGYALSSRSAMAADLSAGCYYSSLQQNQTEQNHSVTSEQNYSMTSEQTHSMTSEQNHSMTSEQGYSINSLNSDHSNFDDLVYSGGDAACEKFDYAGAGCEDTTHDPTIPDNPTSRVLKHLNKILCDKVNVELEEFGNTLQSLLSQQFSQVTHLVSISKPEHSQTSQESKCTQADMEVFQVPDASCNSLDQFQSFCAKGVDIEEYNKSQCLIQLLTSASSITAALNQQMVGE